MRGPDRPPARQQMPHSVFQCCGRPHSSSVYSGNTTARVSLGKGLPGEHWGRGRHSQEMPKCRTRSRMEGGGSGRCFQGGTSSPSKLSRQLWGGMDVSCAAPGTSSLGIGRGNGSGEIQIHPERFSADPGWAGAGFGNSLFVLI